MTLSDCESNGSDFTINDFFQSNIQEDKKCVFLPVLPPLIKFFPGDIWTKVAKLTEFQVRIACSA